MADYKETTISGTEWQRARLVQINNERGKTPVLTFVEEKRTVLADGRSIGGDVSQLELPYDPTAEFDLYDPVTLQPTGQKGTHAQVYGLLFSAYMSTALARDAAQQPTPEPQPTP